jgi:hypothetical protein
MDTLDDHKLFYLVGNIILNTFHVGVFLKMSTDFKLFKYFSDWSCKF